MNTVAMTPSRRLRSYWQFMHCQWLNLIRVPAYTLPTLMFFLQNTQAQNWYWGTGLDGKKKEFQESEAFQLNVAKNDWQQEIQKLNSDITAAESSLKSETDKIARNNIQDNIYKLKNRLALALISLNRTDEALEILNTLEKEVPGESRFAENFAYEYAEP